MKIYFDIDLQRINGIYTYFHFYFDDRIFLRMYSVSFRIILIISKSASHANACYFYTMLKFISIFIPVFVIIANDSLRY